MKADFDAQDLAKRLTITVTIKRARQWRIRLWIAKQLIRLAGFIAWVDVEFVDDIKKRREEKRLAKVLDDFEEMISTIKEQDGS